MEMKKMGVLISNRQKKYKISLEMIKQQAQAILNGLGAPDGELSILIVDDSIIELLNKKYLDRSRPTNVLAFSMQEGEFLNISPHLLGDVIISAETAYEEGKISGLSLEERMAQLLVHGILHLFGFDHEKSKEQALKMEEKSKELMELIKKIN